MAFGMLWTIVLDRMMFVKGQRWCRMEATLPEMRGHTGLFSKWIDSRNFSFLTWTSNFFPLNLLLRLYNYDGNMPPVYSNRTHSSSFVVLFRVSKIAIASQHCFIVFCEPISINKLLIGQRGAQTRLRRALAQSPCSQIRQRKMC